MGVDANTEDGQQQQQQQLLGTLSAGTRIQNYELVSVLGQGGFGITYQARDTTLGREVAVKEYLPNELAIRQDGTMVVPRSTRLAADFRWGRERFLEEARILATLEGVPSIVRVYDFLEANGTAYMVMGLLRGETLEQRLQRDRSLPPSAVEPLLERLLEGLEEVHKAGFLHRDIKPANIMLDARENPTLIDFGASRAAIADRTATLTAIFTPRYAAAEQLASDKQGPWTDIYALSATLYHAITGAPPPTSVERALDDSCQPLSERLPQGLSPRLARGIDAGLAVRARDRPQSIAAWRAIFAGMEAPTLDATVRFPKAQSADTATSAQGTLAQGPAAQGPSAQGAAPPTPAVLPPPQRPPQAPPQAGGRQRVPRYAALGAAIAAVLIVVAAGGYFGLGRNPASPPPAPELAGRDSAPAAQPGRPAVDPPARPPAPADVRPRQALELDLGASRIELIGGRYVLAGEIYNSGPAPASMTRLKLAFHKGDELLGERTYSLVQGPIAPGGRMKFTLALEDPPAGVTRVAGTVE
jgi:serine/threonine protein kinase